MTTDINWWRHERPVGSGNESGRTTAFRALMVFTFILLFAPQHEFPILAPLRLALCTAIFAVAAHTYNCFRAQRPVVTFTHEIRVITGLLFWSMLTIPLSLWPGGSFSFLLDDYFKTLVVFWLLASVVDTRFKLRRMMWAMVLMAVVLSLMTLKSFFTDILTMEGGAGAVHRASGGGSGLTANPNDMALTLNLIIPFCVSLLLIARTSAARLCLVVMGCLMVGAIIATYSRAGFLTLCVTAVAWFWAPGSTGGRRAMPLMLFALLAAISLAPSSYRERLSTISNIEADETHSAQTRWSDTVTAGKLVLAHPFGTGIGTNTIAMNEARGEKWLPIHNVYLQYGVELGLPGLTLFLVLLFLCQRRVWNVALECARQPALREMSYLAQGIWVSIIAFVVAAFFYPVGYHFYFYIVAGLALAAGSIYGSECAPYLETKTKTKETAPVMDARKMYQESNKA